MAVPRVMWRWRPQVRTGLTGLDTLLLLNLSDNPRKAAECSLSKTLSWWLRPPTFRQYYEPKYDDQVLSGYLTLTSRDSFARVVLH